MKNLGFIIRHSIYFFVFLFIERQIATLLPLPWNFLFRYLVTVTFVIIYLKKTRTSFLNVILIFFWGFVLPDIIIRLFEYDSFEVYSFADLILEIVAFFSTYIGFYNKNWLFAIVSFVILIFGVKDLYQFAVYGNFKGHESIKITKPVVVVNNNRDTFNIINRYKNKTIVLDFWTTSCGICFKKFPLLQALQEKYKNDTTIIIHAVNIPLKRDSVMQPFKIIENKGYSFSVVVGLNNIQSIFGIDGYPRVFILREGKIVFNGAIEDVFKFISCE